MYVDQSHFMNSVKIVPHTLDQESPVNTDVSVSILITCGKHACTKILCNSVLSALLHLSITTS